MIDSALRKSGQRPAARRWISCAALLFSSGASYCAPLAILFDRPGEGDSSPAPAPGAPLSLQLRFDSPAQRIEIRDETIWHTLREEGFNNQVSSIPSSVRLIRRRGQLNNEQLQRLRDQILRSGFFELAERYGAPPNERAYVYTLGVNLDGRQHEVRFYSNPAYGPSPPAFSALENELTELLVQTNQWQASE